LRQSPQNYKRLVVKIGSSLLFGRDVETSSLDTLTEITRQVSLLVREGREVVLVSSGAIALGMRVLKLQCRPRDLASLQAAAALGQHLLMARYQHAFAGLGLDCAQILLTWNDFDERRRYLNARHTLSALLDLKVVPVVNENDTVSTEEIRFGDNDQLSARVAALISADMLIILSDVDGLLDRDKKLICLVSEITPQIRKLAASTKKSISVGGMITKLEAAGIASGSGIPCVLANGHKKDILLKIIKAPQGQGTLFLAGQAMPQRERWMAFGSKPKGRIILDEGAKKALLNKKSLLSVGVLGLEGVFTSGDIVSLTDKEGHEFARGRSSISSSCLQETKGRRREKEVVHCDNIVILPKA
jgi:glutamate 5-kinase